jgi:hypothetical protein
MKTPGLKRVSSHSPSAGQPRVVAFVSGPRSAALEAVGPIYPTKSTPWTCAPEATSNLVHPLLNGSAWLYPDFENAETFTIQLVTAGVI